MVSNVAYTHCIYMVEKQKPCHDYFMNRAAWFPHEYVGENVAYNYHTAKSVVSAWMHSMGHRENLLNPDFLESGISSAKDSKGRVYVTMIYIGPKYK